jgi:hypothetical protein
LIKKIGPELGKLMISYQQRLAAFTDQFAKLVAELDELERLRERVKKAELLLCTSRQTAKHKRACSRRKACDSSSADYYRLRWSRCL